LCRESPAQIFLIGNGTGAYQPKNLTVTKCFACAHRVLKYKYTAYCIFIQSLDAGVNAFMDFFHCVNCSNGGVSELVRRAVV
jgi:hypothetical protein